MLAHCAERLARSKVPRSVEFRDELPRTPVGKVRRRLLVEQEAVAASTDDAVRKTSGPGGR